MPKVSVERYIPRFVDEWNNFVMTSKNATFLFDRSYMDYHSDRFKDHSLMIRLGEKLSGLFVANEREGTIESHGGLTYGGLVLKTDAHLIEVIQMFREFLEYYHQSGFSTIIYKRVPDYLHSFPANEDQFALFTVGARLIRRDTSSVVVNRQRLSYKHGRSQSLKKGGFTIQQNKKCSRFWDNVLVPNLRDRYNAKPVHTAEEMDLLMKRFPENIKLYEIHAAELVAGALVYVFPDCVHTQYLSSTQDGRQANALDVLVDYLINEFSDRKYFSLGTSNNDGGPDLNNGLLAWKEGFGARTFVHDFYEVDTSRFKVMNES